MYVHTCIYMCVVCIYIYQLCNTMRHAAQSTTLCKLQHSATQQRTPPETISLLRSTKVLRHKPCSSASGMSCLLLYRKSAYPPPNKASTPSTVPTTFLFLCAHVVSSRLTYPVDTYPVRGSSISYTQYAEMAMHTASTSRLLKLNCEAHK